MGLVQVQYVPHQLALGSLARQACGAPAGPHCLHITSCIVGSYPLKNFEVSAFGLVTL